MPRKKYEYKAIENVNTLRLAVDFGKLYPVSIVEEGYYILSTKGKKKSAYIVKAIEHYNADKNSSKEIKRAVQRLRIANKAREMFAIDSKEKAIELLSIPKESEYYTAITKRIPEFKKPTKMLCGFRIDDKQAEETHTALYNMSANERVLTISNAVVNYVLDGLDPEMEQVFIFRFILSAINEYQNSSDKETTLNNFILAINF